MQEFTSICGGVFMLIFINRDFGLVWFINSKVELVAIP